MKKLYVSIFFLLIVALSSTPIFATTSIDLTEIFESAEQTIDAAMTEEKNNLMDRTYPVGSVYITTENLSASDVKNMLNGEDSDAQWKEIKDTFLWAKDSKENLTNQLTQGGKSTYSFTTLGGKLLTTPQSMGQEFDSLRFAYMFSGAPEYMTQSNKPTHYIITPDTEEEGEQLITQELDNNGNPIMEYLLDDDGNKIEDENGQYMMTPKYNKAFTFRSGIDVTEKGNSNNEIEIMPPYTVVKMFRRTK